MSLVLAPEATTRDKTGKRWFNIMKGGATSVQNPQGDPTASCHVLDGAWDAYHFPKPASMAGMLHLNTAKASVKVYATNLNWETVMTAQARALRGLVITAHPRNPRNYNRSSRKARNYEDS